MNCTQSKWSSSNTSRWKGGYLQQVMCMFEYRNQTVFKKGQSNLLFCAPFGWVTVIKLCQCCLVPSQVAGFFYQGFLPQSHKMSLNKKNGILIVARILSSCLSTTVRLGWRKSHFLLNSFLSCARTPLLLHTVFCPFFTDEKMYYNSLRAIQTTTSLIYILYLLFNKEHHFSQKK